MRRVKIQLPEAGPVHWFIWAPLISGSCPGFQAGGLSRPCYMEAPGIDFAPDSILWSRVHPEGSNLLFGQLHVFQAFNEVLVLFFHLLSHLSLLQLFGKVLAIHLLLLLRGRTGRPLHKNVGILRGKRYAAIHEQEISSRVGTTLRDFPKPTGRSTSPCTSSSTGRGSTEG